MTEQDEDFDEARATVVRTIETGTLEEDDYYMGTLYRTPGGRYFLRSSCGMNHPDAGAGTNDWINDNDARAWLEQHPKE